MEPKVYDVLKELKEELGTVGILKSMRTLYYDEGKHKENKFFVAFTGVINDCLDSPPVLNENTCVIEMDSYEDEEPYAVVHGRYAIPEIDDSGHVDKYFAMDFMPWDEVMGMYFEKLDEMSKVDTICHILWEITFYGTDWKIIKAKLDEINKIYEG